MCGIVGCIGSENAVEIVLNGLKRLEYRGYDSSGIAAMGRDSVLTIQKAVGKIAELENALTCAPLPPSSVAIGHTRWATHGKATPLNAHPHRIENVAVVHNGIIENFQELREEIDAAHISLQTETDTETVPALIQIALNEGQAPLSAIQTVMPRLKGAFALGIVMEDDPKTLYATRRGAPLCIGLGHGENYIASDPLALAEHTNNFIFLEEDDVAVVNPISVTIYDKKGTKVERPTQTLDLSGVLASKGGYKHFMLKEMHEQPAVVSHILAAYLQDDVLTLPALPQSWADVPQINIVACGTAYYAGLVGKNYFEQLAHIPVNVDVASEFRYRQPPLIDGGVFVAVSQSGETADTLAALEYAKENGQFIVAITNTPTSSIARAADVVMNIHAGQEVAVASTKAFMGMIAVFALVALHAATEKGRIASDELEKHIQALKELPSKLTQTLGQDQEFEALNTLFMNANSALFLGRGVLQPLALEGALKLKEISYIHAEGYASGEMKHGPIALVDETLPVVNLASSTDGLLEKTISNMKEVEARHGKVILITDEDGKNALDADIAATATVVTVPQVPALTAPMVFTVPLQLLAYHVATARGTDVDQPRNLAKSVTVE